MENWEELSIEEKLRVLKNMVKNIQITKYNLEESINAENYSGSPVEDVVINYQHQIDSLSKREEYLVSQIGILEGLV